MNSLFTHVHPARPENISTRWRAMVARMDYAFQPIVNMHSGECLGVEALLRDVENAGFRSIQEVFDSAYSEGQLFGLELALREKAIAKFARLLKRRQTRLFMSLFLNMDNRTIHMPDYQPGATVSLLAQHGLSREAESGTPEVTAVDVIDVSKYHPCSGRRPETGGCSKISGPRRSPSSLQSQASSLEMACLSRAPPSTPRPTAANGLRH